MYGHSTWIYFSALSQIDKIMIPYRISWSSIDGNSQIRSTNMQYSTDNGSKWITRRENDFLTNPTYAYVDNTTIYVPQYRPTIIGATSRPVTLTGTGTMTFDLTTVFSKPASYTITTNPKNNAVLDGSTLSFIGAFRDTSYIVAVTATNRIGSVIVSYVVTEYPIISTILAPLGSFTMT
jgi:hypothetical protein